MSLPFIGLLIVSDYRLIIRSDAAEYSAVGIVTFAVEFALTNTNLIIKENFIYCIIIFLIWLNGMINLFTNDPVTKIYGVEASPF
ncbi:hypothetical protein C1646_683867 [Rhizophagus diaphanus]|nr:hypothetical protein C1646_683867 [Rhizophagus diaphanus] [Rhizophagus sp. MUCL 43196]